MPVVRGADRKGSARSPTRSASWSWPISATSCRSRRSRGGRSRSPTSRARASAFHPLINHGQSAILGICAEVFPPGGGEGTFNLVLAFDHQLAEGRTAARFLGDLRDRLVMHEASTRQPAGEASARVEEVRCSRCQASASELGKDHPLIQTVRADGSTALALHPLSRGLELMDAGTKLRKTVAEFFDVDEGHRRAFVLAPRLPGVDRPGGVRRRDPPRGGDQVAGHLLGEDVRRAGRRPRGRPRRRSASPVATSPHPNPPPQGGGSQNQALLRMAMPGHRAGLTSS